MPRRAAIVCVLALAAAGCGDDAPAPVELVFVTPAEGGFVTGAVTVRVAADDPARVAALELRAGGQMFARLYAPPFEAPLDTSVHPDGALTLEAVAVPVGGGPAVTAAVSVAVDNTAPLLIVVDPAEGGRRFVEDGALAVRAVVADGSGVARLEVRAAGDLEATRTLDAPGAEVTVEIPWAELLPDGVAAPRDVALTVTAVDAVGRESEIARTVTARSRLLWSFDTLGRVTRPPLAAADGTVWVGSEVGAVIHLSAGGAELCRYAGSAGEPVVSSPAAGPGLVLFGTTTTLRALNDGCGVAWAYATPGVYYATPAWDAAAGRLYAAAFGGTLHAISPGGAQQWAVPVGAASAEIESSPIVDPADGSIYVGSFDYRLHAFTSAGAERWSHPTGREIYGDPVRWADRIVFASADRYLYAVGAADGALLWPIAFATDGPIRATPAVAQDGAVAVASQDGALYLVNADGTERWRFLTAGLDRGGPVIDLSGNVYVGDTDGVVHALGPDGALRWRFVTYDAIQAAGVLYGDVLYIGSHDRRLYALDTGPP